MGRKALKKHKEVFFTTTCLDDLKASKDGGKAVMANSNVSLLLCRGDKPFGAWLRRLDRMDKPPRGRCGQYFRRKAELRSFLSSNAIHY